MLLQTCQAWALSGGQESVKDTSSKPFVLDCISRANDGLMEPSRTPWLRAFARRVESLIDSAGSRLRAAERRIASRVER